jgi:hypothetical protein
MLSNGCYSTDCEISHDFAVQMHLDHFEACQPTLNPLLLIVERQGCLVRVVMAGLAPLTTIGISVRDHLPNQMFILGETAF